MKKYLIIKSFILGCFLLFSATFSAQTLRNIPNNQVLVAAHRGDWHYAPENSLKGIELCMKSGVDILETDIRLTQDDQLILMHDETLDRTTSGKGLVSDASFQYIQSLYLKNGQNSITKHKIPTLRETLLLTQNKMLVYFDKAGRDPKGKEKGYKIKKILALLKEMNLLEQGVFVLDYPYKTAKEIFKEDLEKVNYIPVISDKIPNLEAYVKEFQSKLNPVAYQFRIASTNDLSFNLLPQIRQTKAKCFIASTWEDHTAGHDDQVSLTNPDAGWGWLIQNGFTIIETNYYEELLNYLKTRN